MFCCGLVIWLFVRFCALCLCFDCFFSVFFVIRLFVKGIISFAETLVWRFIVTGCVAGWFTCVVVCVCELLGLTSCLGCYYLILECCFGLGDLWFS